MKVFLATFIGLVVAFFSIALLEPIGHALFPVPFKVDPSNLEELKANMHLIPTGAYICVAVAHGLGLLFGLTVARLIEKENLSPIFIIAGFMLFGTIANLFMLPHPVWFGILDVVAVAGVATLTILYLRKKK